MAQWYVSIEHLTDEQLEFLGYPVVRENEEFKVYRDYTGEEQIVYKAGPRFLFVEDINDAVAMNAARAFPVPDI